MSRKGEDAEDEGEEEDFKEEEVGEKTKSKGVGSNDQGAEQMVWGRKKTVFRKGITGKQTQGKDNGTKRTQRTK